MFEYLFTSWWCCLGRLGRCGLAGETVTGSGYDFRDIGHSLFIVSASSAFLALCQPMILGDRENHSHIPRNEHLFGNKSCLAEALSLLLYGDSI